GAVIALAALGGLAAAAGPAAAADDAAGRFAAPAREERPMYRFWSPTGTLDRASIDAQLGAMADSGAGGVEASTFVFPGPPPPGYDAATESFGTPAWSQATSDVFESGKAHGLRVDQTYTAAWSAGTPRVSPDGARSAKQLSLASTPVDAGASFSGPLPTSALPAGVTRRELVAALAYRCVERCDGSGGVPVLDQASVVDLTGDVQPDGTVSWAAPASPAGASWLLVGAWEHGTGQWIYMAGTPRRTYLVDHFDKDGINEVQDYWDDEVFTPRLRDAMRDSGGSLFFDSLELNEFGREVRHWTPDLLREFQARRGYSLVPHLAAIAVARPSFEFAGDVGRRVREDYNRTLSDLFRDNHLLPLQQWADTLGMTVRGQAYSSWGPTPLDAMEMYTLQDVPEGEDRSFTQADPLNRIETRGSDAWRAMSSAAAWGERAIVSTECCSSGTMFRYPRETLAAHVNQQFSTGVNQIVFHGWADRSPQLASAWPSWEAFGIGSVADSYGPHNPSWQDDKAFNDYIGRAQTVLRAGELRRDVAIYHQGQGHSAAGETGDPYLVDERLEQAGYQHGFMNRTMVAADRARVSGGRLDPEGQAFGAFVIDNVANVNSQTGALDLATARRVLSWAKAGLPIVFAGPLPDRVFGNHPGQDAQLRALVEQIVAQPSATHVASEAEIVGALSAAGVTPAAAFEHPSPISGVHRETDDTHYWFLFNHGDETVSTSVALRGAGLPYRLDGWSGETTAVARYERTADGVRVPLRIRSGDAAIIALSTAKLAGEPPAAHVAATTADEARYGADGTPRLRAASAGTYTATLGDGRRVETAIGGVPAVKPLREWTLDVVSWQQGATFTDVAKVPLAPVDVTAGGDGRLPAWNAIAAIGNRSGVGTYRTTIDLGAGWDGGHGAYLDLGRVLGSFTVKVNGTAVAQPNQVVPDRIDLGPHLRAGSNEIEVRVASLLGNAAVAGVSDPYGLIGPVALEPYGEVAVPLGGGGQPEPPRNGPEPPRSGPAPPTGTPQPPRDRTKPRVTKAKLTQAARRGTAISIRFTLSERARVRATLERKRSGRVRGGRCVVGGKPAASGKRCVVWRAVRGRTVDAKAGTRTVTIATKRQSRGLPLGAYRVTLRATDAAGNGSTAVRTTFRIAR
ncbi:glycosyl hydrolase, partial [Conexibacter stalactiti]